MSPAPTIDRHDAQGLLASGYGHLPAARYLLAEIADPAAARGWLARRVQGVTTAAGRTEGAAMNIALTASGLTRLGLGADALAGFSLPFREGMTTAHRSRLLGDVGGDAPDHWAWGGPRAPRVDVLVLLYAADPPGLTALARSVGAGRRAAGLRVVARLDAARSERDHFGFRDGIAQPAVAGLHPGRPDDSVEAGEFLLGYPNEYGRYTERPLLDPAADPAALLPGDAAGSGRRDLGRNGSYLVFRQLSQDVPAFWRFLAGASPSGYGGQVALAAKMVGRWPGGAPLALSPERDDPRLASANDFGYHAHDALGVRCPLGAHIRRAHPRDSLDPSPGTERSIAVDKHHRLLRRGRPYGPPMDAEAALATAAAAGVDGGGGGNGGSGTADARGLHFLCLGANLARQFETVQHTWCNNPRFNGLYGDPDPLLGPAARAFTVQGWPTRRRIPGLPAFVGVRGGAYLFLPGIRALRYLAGLEPPPGVSR